MAYLKQILDDRRDAQITKYDRMGTAANHETRGPTLTVHSGKPFHPLDPRPEEIDIIDIAESLSKQCRFAGHTKRFYSVAQHCVILSLKFADPTIRLWALLHDASEAYLVDIPRPLKVEWPKYYEHEERIMRAVAERFDLPWPMPEEVAQGDVRMLFTEKRDVLNPSNFSWGEEVKPYEDRIIPCSPEVACASFIDRFRVLSIQRAEA